MGAVTAAVSAVGAVVNYEQERKKQKAEKKALNEQKKIDEARIAAKKQQYKEEKINLLNAKVASQRAKLGANGVDATSGSSAALISNLEKDTNEEIARNDYFSELDLNQENANYDYKSKVNLLNKSKTNYNLFSNTVKSSTDLFSNLWQSE
ncbi:hypothetical protein HDR59_05515 [bacterium]|nr:hypothetical protein [bacterium]